MNWLRMIFLVFIGALLSTQAYAHGLNKVGDKAVLFKQHGNLLVKAEMTPNSVNYNTDNSLYITVIDQEAGRFYQGEISAELRPATSPSSQTETYLIPFDRGVKKTRIKLPEGGYYQLKLNFGTADRAPAVLDFQLDDNRQFARTAIIFVLSGILISIIVLVCTLYVRKNLTISSTGRKLTCET